MDYVMGFLFSPDKSKVVLIEKNRPDGLAGKLNGVGGKVDGAELFDDAMQREFIEEAGLFVEDWGNYRIFLFGDDFRIFVFSAVSENYYLVSTMTDEKIVIVDVCDLFKLNLAPMVLPSIAILCDDSTGIRISN